MGMVLGVPEEILDYDSLKRLMYHSGGIKMDIVCSVVATSTSSSRIWMFLIRLESSTLKLGIISTAFHRIMAL